MTSDVSRDVTSRYATGRIIYGLEQEGRDPPISVQGGIAFKYRTGYDIHIASSSHQPPSIRALQKRDRFINAREPHIGFRQKLR